MRYINFITMLAILISFQATHAIVGYDKSEIKAESPVYYNTVALLKKDGEKFRVFCSASIVSENMVFTAKHCIEAVEDLEIYVYFGDDANNISESLIRKVITRTIYNKVDLEVSFPSFDFGYLEIEGSIPLNLESADRYKPIDILTNPEQVLQADEYIVAGFGISETSPDLVHGIKRRVKTKVRNYVSNAQFVSVLLLEGNKGEGTCHGDSGGPLYAKYNGKWYLVGVASGFDIGLTPGSYKVIDPKDNELAPDCYGGQSVYTYVGDYTNWVGDISSTNPMVSEVSQISRPGLDIPTIDSPSSFSELCESTNYNNPAWETIRQLLYFAADAESDYSSDQVLSSCKLSEKVLNSVKKIKFDEDTFFNDLSPLNFLNNLESLSFVKTKVPDLTPIPNNKLKSLQIQQVGAQSILSIKGLSRLDSLIDLDLTGNSISSITELQNFTNLKSIKLGSNDISDVSLLANFKDLEVIEFYSNSVTDITSLLGLSKLRELLVSNNKIISPTETANWPNLEMAILSRNKLVNLNFLSNSKNIKRLKTFGNPLEAN